MSEETFVQINIVQTWRTRKVRMIFLFYYLNVKLYWSGVSFTSYQTFYNYVWICGWHKSTCVWLLKTNRRTVWAYVIKSSGFPIDHRVSAVFGARSSYPARAVTAGQVGSSRTVTLLTEERRRREKREEEEEEERRGGNFSSASCRLVSEPRTSYWLFCCNSYLRR